MECPVCHSRMHVETIEKVHVDICPAHGVWLDAGELDALRDLAHQRGKGDGFVDRIWDYTHTHGSF